jgi:hypothetical protein
MPHCAITARHPIPGKARRYRGKAVRTPSRAAAVRPDRVWRYAHIPIHPAPRRQRVLRGRQAAGGA